MDEVERIIALLENRLRLARQIACDYSPLSSDHDRPEWLSITLVLATGSYVVVKDGQTGWLATYEDYCATIAELTSDIANGIWDRSVQAEGLEYTLCISEFYDWFCNECPRKFSPLAGDSPEELNQLVEEPDTIDEIKELLGL